MQRLSLALLLLAAAPAFAAEPAAAYTAPDLLAKNLAAHGGAASLAAITTLTRSGKLLVNGGQLRLDYVQMQKRGGKVREEATLQGLTVVQAHNGSEGWQINPFQGRKDPERTPPDDSKGLVEDSTIGGALAGYVPGKAQLDYLGTEDVDGTPAHKLKLTKPDGDSTLVYLDPDYFLEIRTISQRSEHGVPIEIQTDYGDYEKVGGVYFPFSLVTGRKGSADTQKTIFEKGEANQPIDDAKFDFPAPSVKVGPVTKAKDAK